MSQQLAWAPTILPTFFNESSFPSFVFILLKYAVLLITAFMALCHTIGLLAFDLLPSPSQTLPGLDNCLFENTLVYDELWLPLVMYGICYMRFAAFGEKSAGAFPTVSTCVGAEQEEKRENQDCNAG